MRSSSTPKLTKVTGSRSAGVKGDSSSFEPSSSSSWSGNLVAVEWGEPVLLVYNVYWDAESTFAGLPPPLDKSEEGEEPMALSSMARPKLPVLEASTRSVPTTKAIEDEL